MRRVFYGLVLLVLLVGTLTLSTNIQPVRASETVYIRADGRVEGTNSIETVDNVTYVFLADINGSIIVERDNIMIDGAGHTLQGSGAVIGVILSDNARGISLSDRANVTVRKMQITGFDRGLHISNCTNITVFENNIVKNNNGIFFLLACSNSDVSANNITANFAAINTYGWTSIYDENKSYMVYHNNFVDNVFDRYLVPGWVGTFFYNLSYPAGGNYWSKYSGTDLYSGPYQNETGSDGIGDSIYTFAYGEYTFQDYYPLMSPWTQIVGDLNGDGKVTLADLMLLASAYKSQPGDPKWNPLADIAPPYGIISLTDLVTMALHYGQHNP